MSEDKTPQVVDDSSPPLPNMPTDSPAPAEEGGDKPLSRFERPFWRYFCVPLLPLLTNTAPIIAATVAITLTIRSADHADKMKFVGVAAQVEIIKGDVTRLRDLAIKLRRKHVEIDDALVARGNGMSTLRVPVEALEALADLDDALYFVRVLDDRKSNSERYNGAVKEARVFVKTLHDCLAPAVMSEDVREICGSAAKKYHRADPQGMDPSLALHHVDNAMLAVLRQLD
jgi:hypothetical protein